MQSNTPVRLVAISILNWNAAELTLKCIQNVLASVVPESVSFNLFVIDNGSRAEEWERLRNGVTDQRVTLHREENNLGFTGGQNVGIRYAIEHGADYVWLLNNDALIQADALAKSMALMDADPRCGAASPLIRSLNDPEQFDFVGAQHDWGNLASTRFSSVAQAKVAEENHPSECWLTGTALLLRVAALKEVGLLRTDLFAYYDDDDICVRLARQGWRARLVFEAEISHPSSSSVNEERPPYYFYLMARNQSLFFQSLTPEPYRRLIRLRLFERCVLWSYRLEKAGYRNKATACLLGGYHGLLGKGGAVPTLKASLPLYLRLLRGIFWRRVRPLI